MRTFLLLLSMMWLQWPSVAYAGPAGVAHHTYEGWLNFPDGALIIFEPEPGTFKGAILRHGDVMAPAEFCPADEKFVCFITDDYAFAFPKSQATEQRSWEYRNIRFELDSTGQVLTLLGRKLTDLLLIRQVAGGTLMSGVRKTDHYYLYKPSIGIVAIGDANVATGARETSYFLAGDVGFGAFESFRSESRESRKP